MVETEAKVQNLGKHRSYVQRNRKVISMLNYYDHPTEEGKKGKVKLQTEIQDVGVEKKRIQAEATRYQNEGMKSGQTKNSW